MTLSHTQTFIDQWHKIFEQNNPALMLPLIHDEIEFYSPAIFKPKHGKQVVFETLEMVFKIFDDYRVTDTWVKDNEILFEFEAGLGKYTLQGVDRFRLNEEGKVVQMKVWIRPLSGLKVLARTVADVELKRRISPQKGVHKFLTRAQIRIGKLLYSLKEGLK